MTIQKKARRERALVRLEAQLKSGQKPSKETGGLIGLTDKDKARISKEIATLKG